MADKTLSDVVQVLKANNANIDKLVTMQTVYGESNRQELLSLQKVFMRYFKTQDRKDAGTAGDDLEKRREGQQKTNDASQQRKDKAVKNNPVGNFKMPGFEGLKTGIIAALTPAALFAFGKRILGGGLLMILSREIADAVGNYFGKDQEFKDGLQDAIKTAGFMSIFTRNLPLIAAAAVIKGVLTAEEEKELVDAAKAVGVAIKDLYASLNLPSIKDISANIVQGIQGIQSLLTGDFGTLFGKDGKDGLLLETIGVIAGLAVILGPGKSLRLALTGAVAAWSLVEGSILKLSGLGKGINSSAAGMPVGGGASTALTRQQLLKSTAGMTAAQLAEQGLMRGKDGAITTKTGQNVSNKVLQGLAKKAVPITMRGAGAMAGRTLAMLALGATGGPVGLALTAAVLGGTALYAVSQTDAGQSFIQKYITGPKKTQAEKDEAALKRLEELTAGRTRVLDRDSTAAKKRMKQREIELLDDDISERRRRHLEHYQEKDRERLAKNFSERARINRQSRSNPGAEMMSLQKNPPPAVVMKGGDTIDASSTSASAMVLPDSPTIDPFHREAYGY